MSKLFQRSSTGVRLSSVLLTIFLLTSASLLKAQAPVLPVDFESAGTAYTFTDFDGGVATKVANPFSGGINTSANVGKMVKNAGQVWGGSYLTLATPIDFTTNKTFKVKVYMPRVGAKLLLKVENLTNGAISYEKEVTGTVANAWEELTFDYSAINTANQYSKLVFIFDLGTMGAGGANFTYYFDDVKLVSSVTPPDPNQMNLPVTFDVTTTNYGLVGFGGAENSTIVAEPGVPTNKVGKVVKSATAELWAGTTLTVVNGGTQTGFSAKVPFTATEKRMNVRVKSTHAPIQVRLKVEDYLDATKTCETEATVTTANVWQTLTFDFGNPAAGTAALNLTYYYNKASIFFNFGVTGAVAGEKTYYFDDVYFGAPVVPVELTSFTSAVNKNVVTLNWTTATETNNRGFEIERSTGNGEFVKAGFIPGHGTTVQPEAYSFSEAMAQGSYTYRLKQIDFDGSTEYSHTVYADVLPVVFALEQNYPNPFNPSTKISYSVQTDCNVSLNVYNSLGQLVASPVNSNVAAGNYSVTFDASHLGSGVYYYILKATGSNGNELFKSSRKMIVTK